MQIPIEITVPHSEYRAVLEDLFKTKLSDVEAGGHTFNIERELEKGIILKEPIRAYKESVAPPETIFFLIDIGQDVGRGVAISVISVALWELLKRGKYWLKVGKRNVTELSQEEFRKIIREELEENKKDED